MVALDWLDVVQIFLSIKKNAPRLRNQCYVLVDFPGYGYNVHGITSATSIHANLKRAVVA